MSPKVPGRESHEGIIQDATASNGSWVNQAAGDITVNFGGVITDGPHVSVRPPFGRLERGPEVRGRQVLLDELAGVLDDATAGPRVRVLHGLGGAGANAR